MKKNFFVSTLLLLSLAAALIFCLSACREPEAPPTPPTTGEGECPGCQTMLHSAYVAPTCKSTGRSEYWECETCRSARVDYKGILLDGTLEELNDYMVLPVIPHERTFAVTETAHSLTQYRCGCPWDGEEQPGEAHTLDAHGRCEICSYQEGSPEVTYQINAETGEAVAVGFSTNMLPEELRFASHYQGYEVTVIELCGDTEEEWFYNVSEGKIPTWRENSVKTLVIPYTVKTIRDRSFYYFKELENVVFAPNARLELLGFRCFFGCKALTSVMLPEGLVAIDSRAFEYCTALTNIRIPEGVKFMGSALFAKCKSLGTVALPARFYETGKGVLSDCTGLQAATVPDGIKYLAPNLFSGCSKLRSVRLPKGLEMISDGAFRGCEALCEVNFPTDLRIIGHAAFSNTGLETLNLPKQLTQIGSSAFSFCDNLYSVVWPANISRLEANVFRSCNELRYVHLPEGVVSIGEKAFSGCDALQEITMPKSVCRIEANAFYGCHNLKAVRFSGTVGWRFVNEVDSVKVAVGAVGRNATYLTGQYREYALVKQSD